MLCACTVCAPVTPCYRADRLLSPPCIHLTHSMYLYMHMLLCVSTCSDLDSQVEDELNRQAGRQLRQAGSGRTLPLPSTQVLYNTLATHRKITLMQVGHGCYRHTCIRCMDTDGIQSLHKCGINWYHYQCVCLTSCPSSPPVHLPSLPPPPFLSALLSPVICSPRPWTSSRRRWRSVG